MTYLRLPYDDAATTTEMAADCVAVGRTLGLPGQRDDTAVPAPGPAEPPIVVSDDLAELAAGLELRLD
jgi:hypothetical protein